MKNLKNLTACVLALLLFGACLTPAFAGVSADSRPACVMTAATPDEATPDEATPDEATPDEATPDEGRIIRQFGDAIEITLIDAGGKGSVTRYFTGADRMAGAQKWIIANGGSVKAMRYTGTKIILKEIVYPDEGDEDPDGEDDEDWDDFDDEDEDLDEDDEDSDEDDEDLDDEDNDADDDDENLDDEDDDSDEDDDGLDDEDDEDSDEDDEDFDEDDEDLDEDDEDLDEDDEDLDDEDADSDDDDEDLNNEDEFDDGFNEDEDESDDDEDDPGEATPDEATPDEATPDEEAPSSGTVYYRYLIVDCYEVIVNDLDPEKVTPGGVTIDGLIKDLDTIGKTTSSDDIRIYPNSSSSGGIFDFEDFSIDEASGGSIRGIPVSAPAIVSSGVTIIIPSGSDPAERGRPASDHPDENRQPETADAAPANRPSAPKTAETDKQAANDRPVATGDGRQLPFIAMMLILSAALVFLLCRQRGQ